MLHTCPGSTLLLAPLATVYGTSATSPADVQRAPMTASEPFRNGYAYSPYDTPPPSRDYWRPAAAAAATTATVKSEQYEQKPHRKCAVCGEKASGNFFGAMVCLPCKTFFIRCSTEDLTGFRCRVNDACVILGAKRSKCKCCRYRKCIVVGMARKERPEHITVEDGQQQCVVCMDVANGVHFGIISCEGCKKFFRRGLQENDSYACKLRGNCVVNPKTRNDCRYCRFRKCLYSGMSRNAIKMGRPRKNCHSSAYDLYGTSPTSRHSHWQPYHAPSSTSVSPLSTPTSSSGSSSARYRASSLSQGSSAYSDVQSSSDLDDVTFSPPAAAYATLTLPCYPVVPALTSTRLTSTGVDGVHRYDEPLDMSSRNSEAAVQLHCDPTRTNLSDVDFSSAFPPGYWLHCQKYQNAIELTARELSESQRVCMETLVNEFSRFSQNIISGQESSMVSDMCQVIDFIRLLPGYSELNKSDEYVILKLGWVQVAQLVTCLYLYDEERHAFTKDIVHMSSIKDQKCLHQYNTALLNYARDFKDLRLSTPEACLLIALIIMATDWPNLSDYAILDEKRKRYMSMMQCYVSDNPYRIRDMFSYIPQLRQLAVWHYRLTL